MTYYDIVKEGKGSEKAMWESVERISGFLEEVSKINPSIKKEVDLIKIETMGDMLGGHFTEEGAKYALSEMKPVILMKDDKVVNMGMWDYMYDLELTPTQVAKAVQASYIKAKDKLAPLGKLAPIIPVAYNDWDKFVTMAMVLADNPMTISGDITKGAMLTYEYLSDPDSEDHKIWEYIFS